MTTHVKNTKNRRARYFDWFVLAGLIMNVLVVSLLVGIWVYKTFIM